MASMLNHMMPELQCTDMSALQHLNFHDRSLIFNCNRDGTPNQ